MISNHLSGMWTTLAPALGNHYGSRRYSAAALAERGELTEPEKGKTVGQGILISALVEDLSRELGGRIVVDRTGLKSKHDFTLQLPPEESQAAIFSAFEEQLGLKLESKNAPMEVLVVDHAEKPSAN